MGDLQRRGPGVFEMGGGGKSSRPTNPSGKKEREKMDKKLHMVRLTVKQERLVRKLDKNLSRNSKDRGKRRNAGKSGQGDSDASGDRKYRLKHFERGMSCSGEKHGVCGAVVTKGVRRKRWCRTVSKKGKFVLAQGRAITRGKLQRNRGVRLPIC